MSSPKNEKQTSKIYENKIKNEAKNQQDPQNKTAELNRENKKKILELSVLHKKYFSNKDLFFIEYKDLFTGFH